METTFPDVTLRPEPLPKRVLAIAVDPANPDEIYAGIEIGGLIRSLDGGRSWANVIDGLYVNEDSVDLHSVVVSPVRPGAVTVATRIGAFRSLDRGAAKCGAARSGIRQDRPRSRCPRAARPG